MSIAVHKTRPEILIGITNDYLLEAKPGLMAFSKLVCLNYLSMVPEDHRQLPIVHWHGLPETQADKIIEKQYRRIKRYLEGDMRIPMDLEQPWVEALPDPYREQAIARLCGIYGMVPVKIGQAVNIASLSHYLGKSADFVNTLGHILEDGLINRDDLKHLPELRENGQRSVSSILSIIDGIEHQVMAPGKAANQ